MKDSEFNDDLNRVLKYSREPVPVAAMHPELRFTRLGAVLRKYATEPSEVGELAHAAITSDHSQPLDLMPLHLLRDKMQEEPEHPLAGEFKWETVPDRVAVDQALSKWAEGHRWGKDAAIAGIAYNPDSDYHGYNPEVTDALSVLSQQLPAVDRKQIKDSSYRLHSQSVDSRGNGSDPKVAESVHDDLAGDTHYVHPAEHYR